MGGDPGGRLGERGLHPFRRGPWCLQVARDLQPSGLSVQFLWRLNRVAFALQIFNLMKFDSYTRFLKSPLYQECILAEVEGRALPDAQRVPSSPASKHSIGSDHSSVSTPKKVPAPRLALLHGRRPVDLGRPSRAGRPGRAVSGAAVRLLLGARAGSSRARSAYLTARPPLFFAFHVILK